MAMRTLHELRKLVNYLIENDLVDDHTHVIVEMARELNDSNKRQAIERYQRERQAVNQKYAGEIQKIFKEQNRTLPQDLSTYIDRYRLREEQPARACLYTGQTISDSDLFDEFTTDVEHTIPRSLSFDDSLQNKTIAFKYYNNEIKDKLLPSQLPNYTEEAHGYSSIQPRLREWQDKVDQYQERIDRAIRKSRSASTKEAKDHAIQERHFCSLHHRYWKGKLERFEMTDITDGFKNSQLIDTQIIAKYGVLYLKTLFFHVRSTKGEITDKIKRIWGALSKDEKKDRSRHSHHAADAIIQTLLYKERNKPDIYNILAASYKTAEDNKWKEPKVPNPWGLDPGTFYTIMQNLMEDILVYHADRDNVLKQTKKKIRSNGSIVYSKDGGNNVPVYQKGRGIKGSLHKDTFYGAIKIPVKENGKLISDPGGRLVLQKDEDGNDIIKYRTGFVFNGNTLDAIRKAIENIVDDRLRQLAEETGAAVIQKQGYFEIPPSEQRKRRDALAQSTKVYKVKIFADKMQNPIKLKRHVEGAPEHKQWYYVQTDGNYLMAFYENGRQRDFKIINLYELAGLVGESQGLYPLYKEKTIRGKKIVLPLARRNNKDLVLKQNLKVLLYEKSPEEIISDQTNRNLSDRLYKVTGLSIQRAKFEGEMYLYGIITLTHHLEARRNSLLKMESGDYKFGDGKTFRKLSHNKFKGFIENIDFTISHEGTIQILPSVNE
jgi:CRISPR-associated endonuclease Csn1